MRAANCRAALCELAAYVKEVAGVNAWDLDSFFDRILLGDLAEHLRRAGADPNALAHDFCMVIWHHGVTFKSVRRVHW